MHPILIFFKKLASKELKSTSIRENLMQMKQKKKKTKKQNATMVRPVQGEIIPNKPSNGEWLTLLISEGCCMLFNTRN